MKTSACFIIAWLYCLSAIAVADELESSKIKCSELGQKFSAEFKKEYYNEDISMWGNPDFHYNSTLRTCLVYTEVVDGALNKEINATWYYRRITDIYSNKVLAYSRYLIFKNYPTRKEALVNLANVGDVVNLLPDKFATVKAELFDQ